MTYFIDSKMIASHQYLNPFPIAIINKLDHKLNLSQPAPKQKISPTKGTHEKINNTGPLFRKASVNQG